MKKPSLSYRNKLGERELIDWTIEQWTLLHTPNEDDLARDESLIEFPASALPLEARVEFAIDCTISTRDKKAFRELMRDPEFADFVFQRLLPRPARSRGKPKGFKSRDTQAKQFLYAWTFEIEAEIRHIWEIAFGRQDRDAEPFALDIATQIVNGMDDYRHKLHADDLRAYRANRGISKLPRS